jgi:hypothetical protein
MDITTNDRSEPNTAIIAHHHIARYRAILRQKAISAKLGMNAIDGKN